MILKAEVISERPDEYTGKKGLVKSQVCTLIDKSDGGHRCATPLEYTLSEQEKIEWAGKLQDKRVSVGVTEIRAFGSQIRVRGKLLEVSK